MRSWQINPYDQTEMLTPEEKEEQIAKTKYYEGVVVGREDTPTGYIIEIEYIEEPVKGERRTFIIKEETDGS